MTVSNTLLRAVRLVCPNRNKIRDYDTRAAARKKAAAARINSDQALKKAVRKFEKAHTAYTAAQEALAAAGISHGKDTDGAHSYHPCCDGDRFVAGGGVLPNENDFVTLGWRDHVKAMAVLTEEEGTAYLKEKLGIIWDLSAECPTARKPKK